MPSIGDAGNMLFALRSNLIKRTKIFFFAIVTIVQLLLCNNVSLEAVITHAVNQIIFVRTTL